MRELERDLPTDHTELVEDAATLAIVGRGRMGGALAKAARAAGLEPRLSGRESLEQAVSGASAVLLCVPDASIGAAAEAVAPLAGPGALVGHMSGATPLAALAPASSAGLRTFSLHPLQTVSPETDDFTACPAAVSGSDATALAFAQALGARLGMRTFEIAEGDRAAYHAAAAIASNFLVALEESAAGLLRTAGVDTPRELLAPLVLQTAANWAEHGARALTGPIARGDEGTVESHLEAIEARAPELLALYEALADRTRAVAAARDGSGR